MRRLTRNAPILCLLGVIGTGCTSAGFINEQAMLLESANAAAEAARTPRLPLSPLERTEYRIGARDLLEVEVYELETPGETKRLRVRVSQTGKIMMPLIGSVQAVGQTASELQGAIEKKLAKDFIHNPSVNVLVVEFKSRRVTVLGEVNDPGSFDLKENSTTLIHVLALAGSPTKEASSKVFILRANPDPSTIPIPAAPGVETASPGETQGTPQGRGQDYATKVEEQLDGRLITVDLEDLVENGNLGLNHVLQDGDLVHVPKASMCFVTGHVHYSGGFPLNENVTILKALALAGGARDTATPEITVLLRITEKGRKSIPIDLAKVKAGTKSDLLMQPGDVLVLSQSTSSKVGRGFLQFFRGLFTIGYAVR